MLAIPGFLALVSLTAERKPAAGYAARILVVLGVAAFACIFVAEMIIGRFVMGGGDIGAATALMDITFSAPIFAAVMPGVLAFFLGIAVFAIPLVIAGGTLGWTAGLYLVGALFLLAGILSAQVILNQIGNILMLFGGVAAAWLIIRGRAGAQALS
jgi:hypothetical protein